MSYYTKLEIYSEDYDSSSIQKAIKELIVKDNISEDIIGDVLEAFTNGESLVQLNGSYLTYLIENIHKANPELEFIARGVGEEMNDIWLRDFSSSKQYFSAGPFDTSNISENGTPYTTEKPEGEWFTRVDDTTTGWRSFVSPKYLKSLLIIVLGFISFISISYVFYNAS